MAVVVGIWAKAGPVYTPNTWVPLASLPFTRTQMTAFESGGDIYIFCGSPTTSTSLGVTTILWRYNTATNSYTIFTPPTTPTSRVLPWSVGGPNPIVGGGYVGTTQRSDVFEYNPGLNTWTALTSVTGRNAATVQEIAGVVYVMGTFDRLSQSFSTTHNAYDRATNTWSNKAAVSTSGSGSTVYNGKIIYAQSGTSAELREYDPATNSLTTLASLPADTGRSWRAAEGDGSGGYFTVSGYVSGSGRIPTTVTDAVHRYDRPTNTWTGALNPMPLGRSLMAWARIGTRLYVFGGYEPTGGATAQVDAYDM